MHKHVTVIIWLIYCLVLWPERQLLAAPAAPVSDVRVLVDVSGSMKKNDPHNLRAPALRLVVGLLTDGSQAGVWTFAKYVNMLVPHRTVGKDWRIKAMAQSYQIHSYGLFTDIEQVLVKATSDIKQSQSNMQHHLILLSDGLVDISKQAQPSTQSRERIINTLIPKLKARHITVHTIALSPTADHELLKTLAMQTDGWYEEADTADKLQRVFLHVFEKATHRDSVPLQDNHFKIDRSVTQMTLLIFRQDDSKPTTLIRPDHSRITQADKNDRIRWLHEENYDLITIDQPQTGEWQIDARLDPDNRVMVVTDLKLNTTALPNNVVLGETFDINARLTDKGKTITRQDFLKLVDARLRQASETADPVEINLNDSQRQGVYRAHLGDAWQLGRNDIVVTFRSATFERAHRQSIQVVDNPFDVTVSQLKEASRRTHQIILTPNLELIKPEPLQIKALLTDENGHEWPYEFVKNEHDQWQLTISDLKAQEKYILSLQIKAETVRGRQLFLQPKAITLLDDNPVALSEMSAQNGESESASAQQKQIAPEQAHDTVPEPDAQKTVDEPPVIDEMADELDAPLPDAEDTTLEPDNATMTAHESALSPTTILVIANSIILIIIGSGILLWRRSVAASQRIGERL